MDIELFDYDLPEELIAQTPTKKRDECRLMVVNRENKTIEDKHFYDIINYFKKNGFKWGLGIGDCGNAKAIKEGTILHFKDDILVGECVKVLDEGIRHIYFKYHGIFLEELDKIGLMPLPPYIKKQVSDNNDYQTVYAKVEGSAAAPTAGFHFTNELLQKLEEKGVIIVDITLNVGLGTFRPVKVKDTKDHIMHSEYFEVSKEAAVQLNLAKKENRRIIACGTTSVRTLEAVYLKYGIFKETKEKTSIFIEPGYSFRAVDALITNFHLPKSTLIMLISAFMGREFTLQCYRHAVDEKYRFFSFGDAMFIYGKFDYTKEKLL